MMSARQEQPTKTRVVNCGTQPHSVVATEPKTGMSTPSAETAEPKTGLSTYRYSEKELRCYPWLRRERPLWERAYTLGLEPDRLASEDKCLHLFARSSDGRAKWMKTCSPRSLSTEEDDEYLFPLVGTRWERNMPTLKWLAIPYTRPLSDTCKRKRKRKTGTCHPRKKVKRSTQAPSKGCGLPGSPSTHKLFTRYKGVVGTPDIARRPKEAKTPRPIMSTVKDDSVQQMDPSALWFPSGVLAAGQHEPPLTSEIALQSADEIWASEEQAWVPWLERPVLTVISVVEAMLGEFVDSGGNPEGSLRLPLANFLSEATIYYNRSRKRQPALSVRDSRMQLCMQAQTLLLEMDQVVPQGTLARIVRFHRMLDEIFTPLDALLCTEGDWVKNLVVSNGAMTTTYVPSFSTREGFSAFTNPLMQYLIPRTYVMHTVAFRDFKPVGVPPHWDQGGQLGLIIRAVLWGVTDFSVPNAQPSPHAAAHAFREYPGAVAVFIARALRSSMHSHNVMYDATEPEVQAWLENCVYQRRNEYTTLLENLLQQDIPYWNKIEPVIFSLHLGWQVFSAHKSGSISRRIAAAVAIFIQAYVQHSLASRTFVELLNNSSSMLYNAVTRLFGVLEKIWRRSNADQQQSWTSENAMDWFSKICAGLDSEFTSMVLKACAFVGAVITCPWSKLGEATLLQWADKVVSFLTSATATSLKKLSFFEQLWELIKFFFIRARLAWTYGDFSLFLYGKDEFNDLIAKVNTLVSATAMLPYMSTTWSEAIVDGVPYNLDSYKSLLGEIGKIVKQIQNDLKERRIKSLPTVVSAAINRYTTCVASYDAFMKNQRNRPLPYVLFMVGPPAAGKNTLLEEITEKVFKVCSFPHAVYEMVDGAPKHVRYEMRRIDPCIWTANPFDDYASAFTNMHNVVSYVEPTLAKPNTAEGIKHSFSQISQFFSMVDTAPYSPVMANVDEKGKMSASGVLMATVSANDDTFNKWMLTCPMALLRRIGRMLVIRPYAHFQDPVTQGLDKRKIRATDFKTDDDMWYFEVRKPRALGSWNVTEPCSDAEWVIDPDVGEQGYIYTQQDLMDWLVRRINDHFAEQMSVMAKSERAKQAECCSMCYRSGHTSDRHCVKCAGLSCACEGRRYGQNHCAICSEFKVGCAACEEQRNMVAAYTLGKQVGQSYQTSGVVSDELKIAKVRDQPSHCSQCYRWALAPLVGRYTCYSPTCRAENRHSLRGAFLDGLAYEGVAPSSQSEDAIAAVMNELGLQSWVEHCGTPPAYKRGHDKQQSGDNLLLYTCCAAAGGVALGIAATTLFGRCRINVAHTLHVDDIPALNTLANTMERTRVGVSETMGALGLGARGTARSTHARNNESDQLPYIQEISWFEWARGCVPSFRQVLSQFSTEQWVRFAKIVGVLVGLYGLTRLTVGTDCKQSMVSVVKHKYRSICAAIISARKQSDEQQMKVFDSEFIRESLHRFGLTTGARASAPSMVRIDNPWLETHTLSTKVNFGKRTMALGPSQCTQAMKRIEKSIYLIGNIVTTKLVDEEISTNTIRGSHQHALLLGPKVLIVNTHFIINAIVEQAILQNPQVDRRIIRQMVKSDDWDEVVEIARDLGVHKIVLVYDRKFETSTSGLSVGTGIRAHEWEHVDLAQIAGNVTSDISLVQFKKMAPNNGGGVVFDMNDLSRGLLVPREHTAPTDAVLFPGNTDKECANAGVAVYSDNIDFSMDCCGITRDYKTKSWTISLSDATQQGDCGLPLVGIHHTKYEWNNTTDPPSQQINPAGDTVGILGMHRVYSVHRGMAHAAPLSIDLISYLMGKLDDQMRDAQQTASKVPLYMLRRFNSGRIPTTYPRMKINNPISNPLDFALLSQLETTNLEFKSGSTNVYHDKSPLQWMGKGLSLSYAPDLGEARALCGEAVGSIGGFRQGHFSSSVTRLPMANYFGFEQRHVTPQLNDRRGKEMNLVAMAGAHDGVLDYVLARKVAGDLAREIITNLDEVSPKWRESVHPLTDAEAIAGSAQANFTPGINRSTGMGYPYYGAKDQHVVIERDAKGEVKSVHLRDEVLESVRSMIAAYSAMERANPVFTATPKDERLSTSKIVPVLDAEGERIADAHNLRIFLCGSYPFVHLQRQQYLSVIRLICEYPEVFGMAVGTNVASARWGKMKDWLTWNGIANDHILAGDYSKFDKRMTSVWIELSFEVLLTIMRESGNYHDGDMRIAEGIAHDTAVPLIDWFGDWFFVTNGHPSGHALTTIINGIANQLYLRYAFYMLWARYKLKNPKLCNCYRQYVRTYVYGDDNISGVVGSARDFFTMPAICEELKKIGVILTTEDKTEVVEDFTSIDRAAFLKRSWRTDGERVVAPLARKSLEAMVTIGVVNHKDINTQMYQILRSFCDEFFHYGEEEFKLMRAKVISLCLDEEYWCREGYPLVGLALRRQIEDRGELAFPTYDQMVERWNHAAWVPICDPRNY